MLTDALWHLKKPPFTWVEAAEPAWTSVHRQMICKWIDAHCSGWCYWDGEQTYVFGSAADAGGFRAWIASHPFLGSTGAFEAGITKPVEEPPP